MSFTLPKVPIAHKDFLPYINHKTGEDAFKAIAPYNEYEARLREVFAQHPKHQSLQDPHVNAVPIFSQDNDILRICKRDIDEKTHHQKFIIPLNARNRKEAGTPATVDSMLAFKKNFNLFSESSLADLDWTNVVAAGSSVVTSLLPVPDKYNTSKKALREYYHQQLAPSSDVDLFIWGLDEAAALEKVKQIETSVRNAILEEVTTVRTKNAITIASHYPIRHVQIVLRLYKSVSEVLSGFDVDCSCFAYDGNQVYGTPRGIAAFMTQTNTVDLTRRSPSYESRLSKYAHRGFEVYWPELDRSKIDPTIFERSFARTMGLARLLVLEQLPKPGDREEYLEQRREERGRPSANTYYRQRRTLPDNVKDSDPDDIPEWIYDDEVSNYHSFTVPYGPKYHAKKIEKLLYTKDMLLNAEWNQNKDRTVNLHRHPCFIGPLESVIHDCCGFCPEPQTDEEREIAEEEKKIYVSGDLQFMKDDPGRQAIGSFNPLTNDDWTDMAYIGNTQELCQRICNGDADYVDDWCKANADAIDRRDHTGRTPLHLAAQSSTPEVLDCLVNHGARIVSRLVDGMTALHIAAARGSAPMVTTLLEKSEANEAKEDAKEDRKKAEKRAASQSADKRSNNPDAMVDDEDDDEESQGDDSDESMVDRRSEEEDAAMTEGSFVKIGDKKPSEEDAMDGNDEAEPDIYDVDVLTWDTPVSPLHLAILGGHSEVIKSLIGNFGADALLPIKIVNEYNRNPKHAIMTLILAARLVGPDALRVTNDLLAHGASSAQADIGRVSSFHYLVAKRKVQLLKSCIENDGAAARSALNHLVLEETYWRPKSDTPLTTAIKTGDTELVECLLDLGAKPIISLDDFAPAYSIVKGQRSWSRNEDTTQIWSENVIQPVFLAIDNDMPEVVIRLLDAGADIDTVDKHAMESIQKYERHGKGHLHGKSLMETVMSRVADLEAAAGKHLELPKPIKLEHDHIYTKGMKPESYRHWYISKCVETAKSVVNEWDSCRTKKFEEDRDQAGQQQRLDALNSLKARFADLLKQLKTRGAKTLKKLHPDMERSKHKDKEDSTAGKKKDFEPRVTFRTSGSDEVLDGYVQLFEAAWEGDNDQIKKLTLAHWGPDEKMKPLQVTISDSKGFTPFVLAVYRRHYETAKLLLGITNAQFKEPEDKARRRYKIASENEYSASEDDDDDSEHLDLSFDVVDETYTYDNIAELQDSIGSKISAADMLMAYAESWWLLDLPMKDAWNSIAGGVPDLSSSIRNGQSASDTFRSCLSAWNNCATHMGRYAIVSQDTALLRFWLQCCREANKMKRKDTDTVLGFHTHDFNTALERGYIEGIGEMVRVSGAELPLEALIQKSGLDKLEKPKYYQGLSIGGKKMTAWAREQGGSSYRSTVNEKTPPLLQAAKAGGLAAVEWFLSDTPLRMYREYQDKNKDDERLAKLAGAPGGFEKAVGSWLKQRNNLALHSAILSDVAAEKSLEVINYLIAVMPDSIDIPSIQHGLKPLALAFLKGRLDAAKALVQAGADQTTRDFGGRNLVHLALIHASKSTPTDTKKFQAFFDLIDKRLISSMLTERCKDGPGSLTPLASWLVGTRTHYYYGSSLRRSVLAPEMFTIMMGSGGEAALTMMDGSGQFPLHSAVKTSFPEVVKMILDHDPTLLARENAMGQTPLELAHSMNMRDCAKGNPDIRSQQYRPLDQRETKEFAPKSDAEAIENGQGVDTEWNNEITKTWEICKKFAETNPRKRKLVSVNEAREVAKRLAEKKKRETEEKLVAEEQAERQGKKEEKSDEVDAWLGHGALELG
ncbi:MAG: hypothetical protein Q9220_000787 [cf. Caloplaca sp. 1 TL-2023]